MERRVIGGTDLSVSAVGLGGLSIGLIPLDQSRRVIDAALDCGINFIDTANVYANGGGSEEHIGAVLGSRRKDVVLATKFGLTVDGKDRGASRRHIITAIEGSLKRLKTDWIDLYQLHMPDPHTPMEETLSALDDLIKQGKVRHVGCSNLAAWALVDSLYLSREKGIVSFCSAQDEYSVLVRMAERELIPALEAKKLSLIPYSPLAGGLLTGKYRAGILPPPNTRFTNMPEMARRYGHERNWVLLRRLREYAEARQRTILALAFAWLLARPVVCSVIAGATTPEQVKQNAAATAWKLSPQEVADIDRIWRGF